jgi:glycerophosphoryl diester phosphodiesterase
VRVFAWTVDDARTAQRVAGYGVDGIITNKPDVVRKAVGG